MPSSDVHLEKRRKDPERRKRQASRFSNLLMIYVFIATTEPSMEEICSLTGYCKRTIHRFINSINEAGEKLGFEISYHRSENKWKMTGKFPPTMDDFKRN